MPPPDLIPFRSADAAALAAPGREPLSYGELVRRVATLRGVLTGVGIRPGGVVALALPASPEFIVVFLAVSASGACAPLDPALTEPEYAVSLDRLQAQALICEEDTPAASAAAALGIEVLTLRSLPGTPAGICELSPAGRAVRRGGTTDAALLLQTSATTGTPKLVPLTRANLRAMTLNDIRALQLTAADRLLGLMPLFHLHGISAVLTQLAAGGAVMATTGFDAAQFAEWLADFRPTWFSSAPAIHHAILALAREHPDTFRSAPLRLIRSTGAAFDPALLAELEQASGVPVLEGYGLSETGGVARSTLTARRSGSVGRSSGSEIAILDTLGLPLPAGSEGEVAVRGPSVISGYAGDPEATRTAFREGWFHTGDLGRLDADGFLFLSGRLKEVINRGGEKISPPEVDRVLAAHPAVAEAASFAVPHRTLGQDVAAAIVLRSGRTVSPSELRRFAAAHLASFKLPRRIAVVDSIPRGRTGKPKRAFLAQEHAERLNRREPAPLDPICQQLASIWSRVLGTGELDSEDDFFALGGDSLSMAAMLAEVFRSFHLDAESFAVLDFFEEATIRILAGLIATARAGSGGDCTTLRNTGSRPPLFCVPASGHGPYYLRHLARELGCDQPFFVVSPARRENALVPIEDVAASAVRTIRSARRQGPYVLAGHCYGGVVAFETARQLSLDGAGVAGLVLFDTATPGYPKLVRSWRRYAAQARAAVSSLARFRAPAGAADAAVHLRALARILSRKVSARTAGLARAPNRPLLASLTQQPLDGLAMRAYLPRRVAAPILHFIAGEPAVSTKLLDDPRIGWRDFAPAGFEAHEIPGNHISMFQRPNARLLADRLRIFLEHTR